ncbi:two-component system, cell cycle sensor histidine kinase PleC [Azospirillaceae bacterium]
MSVVGVIIVLVYCLAVWFPMTDTSTSIPSKNFSKILPKILPKILIVDDQPANLVVLRKLLARVNAKVVAAYSGNEALALTLHHDFALILLDVNMPNMDGYEVAEILRGEDRTRDTPIIFITAAYKDHEHRTRAYGAGAVDYIEKPIDEFIFQSKIQVFLELFVMRVALKDSLAQLEDRNRRLETEILAHREAESALRRERNLFVGGPVVVFKWRAVEGWPVEYVSRNIFDLFGYDPGYLVSGQLNFIDIIHREDRNRIIHETEDCALAGMVNFEREYRIVCADGSIRWVHDSTVVVRSAKNIITYFDGYLFDITEAKYARDALRESESRFRQALTDAPIPIMLHAENGEVILLSQTWTEVTGYSRKDIPTTRVWVEKAYGPDQAETILRLIHADYALNAMQNSGECQIRTASGERRMWEIRAASLKPLSDGRRLAICMANDITERRLTERRLEEAKIAAEEANRAKSMFLATMSHELRTPLNTILGFSEIIRDQSLGALGEGKYVEYADDINVSGQYLLNLINDILDLSKIEAGKLELELILIDIQSQISSSLRLVRERAHKKNLVVEVTCSASLPYLRADERAVKQVIFNLLSNAIKFTPAGGRITIGAHKVEGAEQIRLSVRDTGCGIPADRLERIFRPFEQVDNRYSRSRDGTGLGLALVKGLVELHGGVIEIESEVGVGTLVAVVFPL